MSENTLLEEAIKLLNKVNNFSFRTNNQRYIRMDVNIRNEIERFLIAVKINSIIEEIGHEIENIVNESKEKERENRAIKLALEFYADQTNWYPKLGLNTSLSDIDKGELARGVLERIEYESGKSSQTVPE